jgi:hypothetical protein
MIVHVWFLLQDCSALAFLLDKLLPTSDKTTDIERSTMARMLIAALASCNHSPEAQTVLVTEVIIILVTFHLAAAWHL